MTYRQAIQIQIAALQEIYDNAAGLRDIAGSKKDKEAFNALRTYLPELLGKLQNVDNSISDADAQYQCKGDYSININTDDI